MLPLLIFHIPGILEAAYFLDGMNVEVIADGCHLPRTLLAYVAKFKSHDRIALVTDAMRAAADEAMAAFSKKQDPQLIDLLMERACYADMLLAAETGGIAFAVRLVREKIDLINILTTVRLLRRNSKSTANRLFLGDALLTGGTLSHEWFLTLYDADEDTLWSRLYYSAYAKLSVMFAETAHTLTDAERCADNFWMLSIREAKFIPYGAEVLIAYLLAYEYEIRNLRILFAAKETGLAADTVRERMRESYV